MRLKIEHETKYRYDVPIHSALQQLRLNPLSGANQQVESWSITLDNGQVEARFSDQFENLVSLAAITPGSEEVTIRCEGIVETRDQAGVIGKHESQTPLWLYQKSTRLTKPGPKVRKLISRLRSKPLDPLEKLHALSRHILKNVAYEIDRTHSETSSEEAIELGHGVCQDHSHVFVTAARLLGHPARYTSGYLMLTDSVEQAASHAWAEAHVDGIGWVGFDVSNGICPDERYIRVAVGLDYWDAAPISGLRFGDGDEQMDVSLSVEQ